MSEWDPATEKQIARIQYDLRTTSLDSVARQLTMGMFCKGEASDLINLIDREEYDLADRMIRAKLRLGSSHGRSAEASTPQQS